MPIGTVVPSEISLHRPTELLYVFMIDFSKVGGFAINTCTGVSFCISSSFINDTQEKTIFHSIQCKNHCFSASDLFHMFTQLINGAFTRKNIYEEFLTCHSLSILITFTRKNM